MNVPSAALLEALSVPVYTTDAEGRITFYNDAAARLWGHKPELGSLWCGSWRLFWPDGRPMALDECPMAIALKEARPVRGSEAIAERPDGTRVRFMPYPSPLFDDVGRLTGGINLLVDVTERHRADVELARMGAIVAASDDAIISKTLDGRVRTWNAGATRIFGYQAAEMIGRPILRIVPAELQEEENQILEKLRRGERIDHFETVRLTKDGRRVDISLSVSPILDRHGVITGASKIARDITARKQAERMQRLLLDELSHRVKNTLATVQAIASQSLRRNRDPSEFATAFTGRMQALARAHTLLTDNEWLGTEIESVIHEQVVLGSSEDARIVAAGPSLKLDPQMAVHLGLVLHELGTNARKYGALSVPEGRLTIGWELQIGRSRQLVLTWTESQGPRVSVPTTRGFGSRLIEQTVRSHGGNTRMRYDASGLSCVITLPFSEEAGTVHRRLDVSRPGYVEITHHSRDDSRQMLKAKRVLVVEDEPLLSMDIESCLSEAGCEVIGPAGAVDQALRLIAAEACDAAVLDANLSGRAVDEIAVSLTQKGVPFAFITGYGRGALPRGFQDALMLAKPFSESQLRGLVELLLDQGAQVVPLRRRVSLQTG